jgi:hypothetical protein
VCCLVQKSDSTDEGIAEGDTDEDDYDLLEPLEQDSEMDGYSGSERRDFNDEGSKNRTVYLA